VQYAHNMAAMELIKTCIDRPQMQRSSRIRSSVPLPVPGASIHPD